MATVTSTLTLVHKVAHTVSTAEQALVDAGDNTLTGSISASRTDTGSSSPSVNQDASFLATLSTGAVTVDLTAINDVRGVTISLNTKKIRAVTFKNPVTNANAITIKAGAANGHTLFGASWLLVLNPGDVVSAPLVDSGATTVDATHKNWDLTGTGSQALQILLAAG